MLGGNPDQKGNDGMGEGCPYLKVFVEGNMHQEFFFKRTCYPTSSHVGQGYPYM